MPTQNQLIERRDKLTDMLAPLLDADADSLSPGGGIRAAEIHAELRTLHAQINGTQSAQPVEVRSEAIQRHREALQLQNETESTYQEGVGFIDGTKRTSAGGVALQVQDRPRAEVYQRNGPFSFFGDVLNSRLNQDRGAAERLIANQEAQGRALTTVSGAGGQFAPPAWLADEFVTLARPGRVTADLVTKKELPQGASSINLPKVATGTGVGITQTQNTAITQTDLTSTAVSSGITTISGGQTISLELLRQSAAAIDEIVLGDLALAYAQGVELQVLSGSGANGQVLGIDGAGGTTVTYTTSAPAVVSTTAAASFYLQVVKAINTVSTGRKLPPTAIVMHPRRWAWVATGLDTTNRPILPAGGLSENSAGTLDAVAGSGRVGTLAGIPVYTSASIATDIGTATNQDKVYVLRASDLYLWESPLQLESFDATYAAQNSIFVRALAFAAFIPNRYPESIAYINGTGLVDPGLG